MFASPGSGSISAQALRAPTLRSPLRIPRPASQSSIIRLVHVSAPHPSSSPLPAPALAKRSPTAPRPLCTARSPCRYGRFARRSTRRSVTPGSAKVGFQSLNSSESLLGKPIDPSDASWLLAVPAGTGAEEPVAEHRETNAVNAGRVHSFRGTMRALHVETHRGLRSSMLRGPWSSRRPNALWRCPSRAHSFMRAQRELTDANAAQGSPLSQSDSRARRVGALEDSDANGCGARGASGTDASE